MPKQGRSQGKGKPKLADKHFGKALIRSAAVNTGDRKKNPNNMISILDNSALVCFTVQNVIIMNVYNSTHSLGRLCAVTRNGRW